MKIGYDVSQTGRLKAGCGYFADALVRHLAEADHGNDYLLYPTFGSDFWDPGWSKDTRDISQANFSRHPGHASLKESLEFWKRPADRDRRLGSPDIIHSNNFFCPTDLREAKLIYTLYDLSFLDYPEFTTEENRLICFDGVFNAGLHADAIVAISEYTMNHFLRISPHFPPERVRVVYPASRFAADAPERRPEKLADVKPHQFWLNVGTLEPRKNLERLLKAYAALKRKEPATFPLVLSGGDGWLMDGFKRSISELGLERDVILLGYVDDESLRWLYKNCFAFLYPSLFEGFGLPVLEAMGLGAPVVASGVTSLPEIVGDAGVLVEPESPESIMEGMRRLMAPDVRARLAAAGSCRAREFSWEKAASRILELYGEVAGRPKAKRPEASEEIPA